MLAGVWYCFCMVAKKKSSSQNSVSSKRKAQKAMDQYLEAPTNRSQVINPMGYIEGTDGFFMKTKGRYAVANKVYERKYRDSMPPTRRVKKK